MEEKPVNRQPCIPTLKAIIAARRRFFAPHHHFLASLALAALLMLPGAAQAQMNGDAPYPPAAQASGTMQQDDQVLAHDRAVLAHDRASNPSRVSEDEAQYKQDMAAYHRDSDETADHMNGQQVNTTYTSKVFVPVE